MKPRFHLLGFLGPEAAEGRDQKDGSTPDSHERPSRIPSRLRRNIGQKASPGMCAGLNWHESGSGRDDAAHSRATLYANSSTAGHPLNAVLTRALAHPRKAVHNSATSGAARKFRYYRSP
ncbi:hypothetical protein KM043_005219 [Ampulex compressa]|nr:hypothetical protein KM043_005219 [Ampulex compressa]